MKFSLFVHMERFDDAQNHAALFDELTDLVQTAERGGFEAAWIGEHHGMEFTIAPNPFINLAYLGARTDRIRLGTGTVIAPFWHPIRLAGEAAMTDLATGGRLDLGIARGAYSFEYERLMPGLDAWGAGQRMREMIPALRGLWAGDYTHEGEFWQFPKTTTTPKPLQQTGIPVWVAARDPNSHAFAVENGCNVQVTPLASGDSEVEALISRFDKACADAPSVPRPQIMLLQHTFVSESPEETAQLSQDLSRFFCAFGALFQNKLPIEQGFIRGLDAELQASMPQFAPEKIAQNLVIGEPETVIARLKAYEAMGYDQYAVWIDSGIGHARKKRSLELFIRDVMPAFA